MKYFFNFFLLFPLFLSAKLFDSFYGPISVEEPVLIELLEAPAMQRLRAIHQYGASYYITHSEEYSRYDHSLGVFALLRKAHASLDEQIAGLLHDVSHTVFSHVGDFLFNVHHPETDYQNSIHKTFLTLSGLEEILVKHGYETSKILPHNEEFIMLEQPLPSLCADRLDYNLQGAYFQGFLTKDEAVTLYNDFRFEDGSWLTDHTDLLKKLARFSSFMTQDCWGSPISNKISSWLASALKRGLEIHLLTFEDIHFGYDQEVWEALCQSQDALIVDYMDQIMNASSYIQEVDRIEAETIIPFKCRGIDPWVKEEGEMKRLSDIDAAIAEELANLRKKALEGWSIKVLKKYSPLSCFLNTPIANVKSYGNPVFAL